MALPYTYEKLEAWVDNVFVQTTNNASLPKPIPVMDSIPTFDMDSVKKYFRHDLKVGCRTPKNKLEVEPMTFTHQGQTHGNRHALPLTCSKSLLRTKTLHVNRSSIGPTSRFHTIQTTLLARLIHQILSAKFSRYTKVRIFVYGTPSAAQ